MLDHFQFGRRELSTNAKRILFRIYVGETPNYRVHFNLEKFYNFPRILVQLQTVCIMI